MSRFLYATLVVSVSACYVYAPTQETVPETGREIRASLSAPKDLQSGDIIIRDVTRVDGTVYGATGDTLVIWSKWLHGGRAGRYYANGEVHPFLLGDLESVETRRVSPARTAVAVAAAVGIGFGLFVFTADLGGGINDGPGGGDTQTHRVAPSVFRAIPSIR